MANWETEYKNATLGRRIAALRTLRGDKQYEFAAQAGISQPMLSRIEDKGQIPSVKTLSRICGLFGITLNELVPPTLGVSESGSTKHTEAATEQAA